VGTVIQDMPHINPVSQPRWDRYERADLFEQYRELRAYSARRLPLIPVEPCHRFQSKVATDSD
jgi:hypothetical protein